MEQILPMLSDLISTVIMALLVVLISTAKRYVNQRVSQMQDDQLQKISENALSRAEHITLKTVEKIQQTIVDQLKQASKDGKLSEEEKQQILQKAKEDISNLMSEDLKEELGNTVQDINLYVEGLIESAVLNLKNKNEKKSISKVKTSEIIDLTAGEARIE